MNQRQILLEIRSRLSSITGERNRVESSGQQPFSGTGIVGEIAERGTCTHEATFMTGCRPTLSREQGDLLEIEIEKN